MKIIMVGFVGTVVFNGIDDVALVFLAFDVLGGSIAQAGLLYAAVGVGLVVGFLALSDARVRVPMMALFVTGLAVSSAGNLFTGLAGGVAVAFALQAVRGIGIAAVDVAVSTLLQRAVPPRMLGRVFGNLYGAVGLAAGLSYVLGGLALNATSARVVFVVAGCRRSAGDGRHRCGAAATRTNAPPGPALSLTATAPRQSGRPEATRVHPDATVDPSAQPAERGFGSGQRLQTFGHRT